MKKKQDSHKNSTSLSEQDEKKNAVDLYKKVIQTDIYNEQERNAILQIVNNYIDEFNNQQEPSDDEDGFKTVGQQKKRNKFEDYHSFKWKVYNDIQISYKDTTSYIKKQLPYFKMELSNKELNIILNFLSTVINMVEPIIYDDIKPVGELVRENKYVIHIQYFPRITLHQSYEYTLRERLLEDNKYKHFQRAQQIRQGLIKNNFQNLDSIDGFFEDFHVEFKNIAFLGEGDEIKNKNNQESQCAQKFKEDEQNLQGNTFESKVEPNKQIKSLNKSPQFNSQSNTNNGVKQKFSLEDCQKKLIQTIAAMMNTQGGSIFIPIKENQNLEQEQLYSLGSIQITEEQLKNKINSFFDEIIFYHMNGEQIEEQEKTEDIINQLIPNISSIKDEEGIVKVFEIIVYQVYPQYICNLAHNRAQSENNLKLINQKELNFEFPIRRSAANCTVVFSKDQLKQSLEKATLFTKIQKNLSEEDQNKLFNYKKNHIKS
ncbi:divergent AAA domain protein (macronuclear) [Tetrahymena thermophila SB210]|uniref:Divergent AAA domain protein n=1 Tax=Tetrahymena thermophila (strain SB210) TaxID=312017 RepID=I7LZL4_TETTS|nr:divergent AAA domain protein [Tetrahymena thermophila SB210]EAR84151.2 divergent AAA domain protein [Tetrahymena thermophila SB210]|eukprot:XP_001031814.2 divergent AAA domain protein [Tetrahymena thermophila SB210]